MFAQVQGLFLLKVSPLTVCFLAQTEKEIPFLMRIVVQSLLAGSPSNLIEKANALNEAIKLKFPSSDAYDLTEPCPACRAPIPLESLLKAICPKGHSWGENKNKTYGIIHTYFNLFDYILRIKSAVLSPPLFFPLHL